MTQDEKAGEPQAKESGGLLHHLFGQGGHETPAYRRVAEETGFLGHRHETQEPSADSGPLTKSTLNLGDIQGFILRGYRMPMVRHFLLSVGVPAKARELLGRLASGDESDAPQITTAEDWHVGLQPGPGDNLSDSPPRKPDYCVNLGMTCPGRIAL